MGPWPAHQLCGCLVSPHSYFTHSLSTPYMGPGSSFWAPLKRWHLSEYPREGREGAGVSEGGGTCSDWRKGASLTL